ncbi:hypothetical protein JOM56_008031 [Amanita muscaria]
MVLSNNRSNDARVISLLEQILEAIEELTRVMSLKKSPATSSFTPPVPPPSRASSECSTGVVSAPSSSYSSISLSGVMQGVSLQDSRYYRRNIPCSQRWYCVIRGRAVGPIQGWENVEDLTDGLSEAKYQRCILESEAREVYERALLQPGKVCVLD